VSARSTLATCTLAVGAVCVLGAPAAAATKPATARGPRAERPGAKPRPVPGVQVDARGPSRPDKHAGQGTAAGGAAAAPLPGPAAGTTLAAGPGGGPRRAAVVPGSARGPPVT
jgi:hypothetical protein